MALDIYIQDDITRGLRSSIGLAVTVYLANGQRNPDHISGILAHAQAQAMLYGCDWTAIVEDCKHELGTDVAGLLDQAATLTIIEGCH